MDYEEARELIMNGIMRNACIPKEKDWWNGALLKAIEALENAPSIDIVCCGECAKRMTDDCPMCNCCELDRVPTEDDDYCSYGEREGE